MDLADEFPDFLDGVLFLHPMRERFSCQMPQIYIEFWRRIVLQSFG
jgi:hypothetical protein